MTMTHDKARLNRPRHFRQLYEWEQAVMGAL